MRVHDSIARRQEMALGGVRCERDGMRGRKRRLGGVCGSADTAVATGTGETISFAYHIFLFLRM